MRKSWKRHNLSLQEFEESICPKKYKLVAGIDESGRGPLAGPVVACVVIPKIKTFRSKIDDSKCLNPAFRQKAYKEIIKKAHIGFGIVDPDVIDKKNILQATVIAIRKALNNLSIRPDYLLIDGQFRRQDFIYPYKNVIKGDRHCFSIACASIVAKVIRDSLMSYYSNLYPQYGFERNRGYYTKEHLKAIRRYGLTPLHRRTFRPIRKD